jgi:hypothetical protein
VALLVFWTRWLIRCPSHWQDSRAEPGTAEKSLSCATILLGRENTAALPVSTGPVVLTTIDACSAQTGRSSLKRLAPGTRRFTEPSSNVPAATTAFRLNVESALQPPLSASSAHTMPTSIHTTFVSPPFSIRVSAWSHTQMWSPQTSRSAIQITASPIWIGSPKTTLVPCCASSERASPAGETALDPVSAASLVLLHAGIRARTAMIALRFIAIDRRGVGRGVRATATCACWRTHR